MCGDRKEEVRTRLSPLLSLEVRCVLTMLCCASDNLLLALVVGLTGGRMFMREMCAFLFLSFSSFSVSFKVQVEQIQRSSQNTGQTFLSCVLCVRKGAKSETTIYDVHTAHL